MEFIKYNSIENTTNKELARFKDSILYNPNDKWNVTEKIHGSNFAVFFDENGSMTAAKRSSFIGEDDSFFNFQKVIGRLREGLEHLYIQVLAENLDAKCISVHGELCGGDYPNTDIIQGAKKVQKEIYYSNDNEFIIFDIRVYGSYGKDKLYKFLNHEDVIRFARNNFLPVVPILFEGTLNECLIWSQEHNADPSEIGKLFNMPELGEINIREGHVIKPSHKSLFLGMSRVIFKDKNDKFKENKGSKVKKENLVEYSQELNDVLDNVDIYININRFNAVTSKFGEYSIKNFGVLMNLMVDDIVEDLQREGVTDDLSDADKQFLNKILIKKVSAFFANNKKELF